MFISGSCCNISEGLYLPVVTDRALRQERSILGRNIDLLGVHNRMIRLCLWRYDSMLTLRSQTSFFNPFGVLKIDVRSAQEDEAVGVHTSQQLIAIITLGNTFEGLFVVEVSWRFEDDKSSNMHVDMLIQGAQKTSWKTVSCMEALRDDYHDVNDMKILSVI